MYVTRSEKGLSVEAQRSVSGDDETMTSFSQLQPAEGIDRMRHPLDGSVAAISTRPASVARR